MPSVESDNEGLTMCGIVLYRAYEPPPMRSVDDTHSYTKQLIHVDDERIRVVAVQIIRRSHGLQNIIYIVHDVLMLQKERPTLPGIEKRHARDESGRCVLPERKSNRQLALPVRNRQRSRTGIHDSKSDLRFSFREHAPLASRSGDADSNDSSRKGGLT
jgi:hypothetical protein